MPNIIKRLCVWAIVVAAVLMIPLLTKAPWTLSDFVFGGVVLFGAALAYELLTRNLRTTKERVRTGLIVAAVLAFVWVFAATGFERPIAILSEWLR